MNEIGAFMDRAFLMRDAFHRALRPDRHERGRVDLAVCRRQDTAARASVGVRHTKRKR